MIWIKVHLQPVPVSFLQFQLFYGHAAVRKKMQEEVWYINMIVNSIAILYTEVVEIL